MIVKEIIECCNEKDVETCTIMMDFMKSCDWIDREAIEVTTTEMRFRENNHRNNSTIFGESSAAVVTSDVGGERLRSRGGVKRLPT